MGKQSIYLNDKFEDEIRNVAMKEGRSVSEVIKHRIESNFKYHQHDQRLKKMEEKINAIYSLLDLLAGELGYVAGAMRASTKSIEHVKLEGATYENHVRRTASALRKNFEAEDPIEEGI